MIIFFSLGEPVSLERKLIGGRGGVKRYINLGGG